MGISTASPRAGKGAKLGAVGKLRQGVPPPHPPAAALRSQGTTPHPNHPPGVPEGCPSACGAGEGGGRRGKPSGCRPWSGGWVVAVGVLSPL